MEQQPLADECKMPEFRYLEEMLVVFGRGGKHWITGTLSTDEGDDSAMCLIGGFNKVHYGDPDHESGFNKAEDCLPILTLMAAKDLDKYWKGSGSRVDTTQHHGEILFRWNDTVDNWKKIRDRINKAIVKSREAHGIQ